MGWASLIDTVIRALLKIAEGVDHARKKDAAAERAKRVQEIDRRIRNDPVAAARGMFNADRRDDQG